ncbi:MAG: hypothetical protein Q8J68_08035 [Methanolobus sp.]|uniref:hypothetical protein n=1 Tax=Methanolobus sp. TaxID=1874737 RepID=UPI002730397F|nr:hypothetical protein [Methanolobus sp.]MDP2217218.1 hypothetical protein [Methanolobus sp.]
MTQNPYPIVGILQGAGTGVTVTGVNLTAGGTEEVSTESDGSYIIDPANMGTYSDGDVIKISSGTWYIDIKIDIENYPDGIIANLNRPAIITPKRISRGASVERGIACGA